VSCHHNSLVAMAVATARENGYRVDEVMAARQLKTVGTYIESWRERSLQGIGIAGGHDSVYEFVPQNEVWIDNEWKGKTPLRTALGPGRYRVEIRSGPAR
jgi:hypothetical protein